MRVKQSGKKRPRMEIESPEASPEKASPASPKPKVISKLKKPEPVQKLRRLSRAAVSIMAQRNAKLPPTSAENPVEIPNEPVKKPKTANPKTKKGNLMDLVNAATSKPAREPEKEVVVETEDAQSEDEESEAEDNAEGQSEEPEAEQESEAEDIAEGQSEEPEAEQEPKQSEGNAASTRETEAGQSDEPVEESEPETQNQPLAKEKEVSESTVVEEEAEATNATASKEQAATSGGKKTTKGKTTVPEKNATPKKRKRVETVVDDKGVLRSKNTGKRLKQVAVKEVGEGSTKKSNIDRKKEIKRRKAKVVELSVEEIDQIPKFSTKLHNARMQELANRQLNLERGFKDLSKLPEAVLRSVEQQGWEPFVVMQPAPIIALVREFYANCEQSTGVDYEIKATVIGKKVVLNPRTVHAVYGTHPPQPDTFIDLLNSATKEQLDEALSVVSVQGAHWVDETKDNLSALASFLTTEANIWFHFLRNRISSTTHNTLVGQDRILMVAAIIKGDPIDIAPFIIDSIGIQASKKAGPLFCPSLILELCKRAGVPFYSDEPRSIAKSYFNIPYLTKRHAQAQARAQGEETVVASDAMEALLRELLKIKIKQVKLLKGFRMMHKVLLKVKAQTARLLKKKGGRVKAKKVADGSA